MREEYEAAIKRLSGMDEDGKKALEKVNNSTDDWYAVCPFCYERIVGTLIAMTKHAKDCNEGC